MRVKELLEHSISLQSKNWIDLWSSGSNNAIRMLDRTILNDLSRTVLNKQYRLVRSWKFESSERFKEYFGISVDKVRRGTTLTFSNKTPLSWTKSNDIAKQFFNPRFDAVNSTTFTDDEIIDLGFEYGDTLGVSVRALGIFNPESILVDLDHVGGSQYDESEVIVKGGKYQVKVLSIQEHKFAPPSDEHPDDEYPDTDYNNSRLEHDSELIEFIKTTLPAVFDETKLNSIKDTLTAMAWFYKYGPQPPLLAYAKKAKLTQNSFYPLSTTITHIEQMIKQLRQKTS